MRKLRQRGRGAEWQQREDGEQGPLSRPCPASAWPHSDSLPGSHRAWARFARPGDSLHSSSNWDPKAATHTPIHII